MAAIRVWEFEFETVTVASLALLGFGITGALTRPRRSPAWLAPVTCAAVAIAIGASGVQPAIDALRPLRDPLLFLLAVVPLAALLEDLGVFSAAARLIPPRRLTAGLWVLGSVVVALLNLDAAVVLLTPLYVRVARHRGLDPLAMAFQPALLACVASSALPVSNLTNLIAVEVRPVSTGQFLAILGPPTLVGTAVGYVAWRRLFRPAPVAVTTAARPLTPDDRRPLLIGALAMLTLTVGFLAGRPVGVEPWVVALVVDAVLAVVARRVPVRAVPVGTAALATALAVLAAAVASHVDLTSLVGTSSGTAGTVRITAAGVLAANATNNLPAFLVGLPVLPPGPNGLWAWLLGVNIGPVLVVTGSLSGLLWLDAARRCGVDATPGDYFRVGLRVGVPALLAATATLLVTTAW